MGAPRRGPAPHAGQLTPREREVLRALRAGLTNGEIASLLRISSRTVESHVASLMRKFDVHRRRLLIAGSPSVDRETSRGEPAHGNLRPVNTAELDRDGVIVAVNASWNAFCVANGGDPRLCGVGTSYLRACEAGDDGYSLTIADYIRMAVRGGVFVPLQTRIPCHSPTQQRYFDLLVSSRVDDDGACVGAVVSLSQVPSTASGQ